MGYKATFIFFILASSDHSCVSCQSAIASQYAHVISVLMCALYLGKQHLTGLFCYTGQQATETNEERLGDE